MLLDGRILHPKRMLFTPDRPTLRLDNNRLAALPITPRSPTLLRIIQYRPWLPNMDHTPNIGDIDPYTQRAGGRDDRSRRAAE